MINFNSFRSCGEINAIEKVKELGQQYGYGNLITVLRDAWSKDLREKYNFDQKTADHGAGHICAWCDVDSRTGEKAKPVKKKKKAKKSP